MDGLPVTEAVLLALVGAIGAGLGKLWSWLTVERTKVKADKDLAEAQSRLTAEQQTAQDLREAQARLIASAEKRESAMSERLDKALDGMSKLTAALTDNTGVQKLMAEGIAEMKSNQRTIIEELRNARHP